ncbi:MAG: hypothetical protein MK066_13415 [Crocinitomicaceae bacterium]|nr:hypothetical protein [Crocinitomicaceae bacterium]
MKNTRFPDLSSNHTQQFSADDPLIELDGMKVVFDKKVKASPVVLNYKKKRKVIETAR